jgi:16S rRNA (guanine966-N2)-methyltransferase
VFDILGSLGGVDGSTVADLFAGSGALGIEALSRGARQVTFVEVGRQALVAIRENLRTTGFEGEQSHVVKADVLHFLDRPHFFDVVFADPPYEYGGWEKLLSKLECGVAVLEAGEPIDVPPRWEVARRKRYGDTLVIVIRPASSAVEARQ